LDATPLQKGWEYLLGNTDLGLELKKGFFFFEKGAILGNRSKTLNQIIVLELNHLGNKEVMPMIDDSSKIVGLLVNDSRLCAGAAL
jgi:hypothetical protein